MRVGPYTVDNTLRGDLERSVQAVAGLAASGAFTTAAGRAAGQTLRDLFIYHSAGIQGNTLAPDQVRALLSVGDRRSALTREQQEVINLANGLEYVFMLADDDLLLTERLIRIT